MPVDRSVLSSLLWKKFPIGSDGFVCLVDAMGSDADIIAAARISFNADDRDDRQRYQALSKKMFPKGGTGEYSSQSPDGGWENTLTRDEYESVVKALRDEENALLRYLMRHRHGTPLEMAEVKILIRIPMDAWRQFVRHRTLNINEYSTRYTEAIDSTAKTDPSAWRLQSKDNKQGSSGLLEEWPEGYAASTGSVSIGGDLSVGVPGEDYQFPGSTPGEYLSTREIDLQTLSQAVYNERLKFGVAREQARKDLPLSTYTEAYVKCDIRNWFHFLGLRMDSHAQKEIRDYANAIGEQIIAPLFPMAWEAFKDYQLEGMSLSRLEIQLIKEIDAERTMEGTLFGSAAERVAEKIFANKRERQEAMAKLLKLGLVYEAGI